MITGSLASPWACSERRRQEGRGRGALRVSKESTVSETHTERIREMRKREEVEIGNRKRRWRERRGERRGWGGEQEPEE